MTTVEVFVEDAGRALLVGQAHFTRTRRQISTTFLYDSGYLADGGMSIDPALPLVSGSQHQSGLICAFAVSAPDRWGRNLIEKAERTRAREEGRTPRWLDDLDFLVGVSDNTRQGALRFRLPGHEEFLGRPSRVPRLISLPELLHASDELASDADWSSAVKQLLDTGAQVWAERGRRLPCASRMAASQSPSSRTPATGGTSWPGRRPRSICWRTRVFARRSVVSRAWESAAC